MTTLLVQAHHIFGLQASVVNNVFYFDDESIMFPSGSSCVRYNIDQKWQKFIPGSEKSQGMLALALSPNRRYLAISERGEKATVTVYDVQHDQSRKRKSLSVNDLQAQEFVSIAFSPDSKYLIAQSGQPDWTLIYWLWKKQKIIGVMKTTSNANPIYQMRGHTCLVLVFITVTIPVYVSGYSNGLVSSVCATMIPSHGSSAQTTAAPYQITTNSSTFNPGDAIKVTLNSNSGDNFKGFLLEARAAGPSSSVPLGIFSTISQAQLLNCSVGGKTYANSAVSHNSASSKTEIVAIWTAPETDNIEFRATVVKTRPQFWTPVKSVTIKRSVTSVSPTTPHPSTKSVTMQSSVTSVSPTTPHPSTSVTSNSNSNVNSTQFSSDGCGTTKFCFRNPAQCNPARDPNCFFMSSTPVSNQGLRFEMSGKATGYISLGFSDDKIMGNDDIYICGMDASGKIKVQRAHSTGKMRPLNEQLGEVDAVNVANKNGVIQCSFITRNKISTAQRAANNLYYLFFAYGPADGGQIRKHIESPFISTKKVNVSVAQSAEGSNNRSILIKSHGALMLIAWMTTGSIGMIIARFFKGIGGSKKILGKNIWYQLHWSLMVLTVAITIIGFVLAFVQVQGWSYNAGAHSVLGCIVMGLTLIQPTVALCRPSPDNKRRYIFNWFHTLMALVIKVLAVATLFLGFQLINVAPNKWPVKVLGGFVGWEVLTYIILGKYCHLKEMALSSSLKKKVELELLVLIVYLCGNLAFLIALLVGIGQT